MPVLPIWMPPFSLPAGPTSAFWLTDERWAQIAHGAAPADSSSPAWIAWKWSM
jgi:hypothetical protein